MSKNVSGAEGRSDCRPQRKVDLLQRIQRVSITHGGVIASVVQQGQVVIGLPPLARIHAVYVSRLKGEISKRIHVKFQIHIAERSVVSRAFNDVPSRLYDIIGLGQLEAHQLPITGLPICPPLLGKQCVGDPVTQVVLLADFPQKVGKGVLRRFGGVAVGDPVLYPVFDLFDSCPIEVKDPIHSR